MLAPMENEEKPKMRPSAALSPGQGVLWMLQQRVAADGGVAGVTRFMTELLQAQKPLWSSQGRSWQPPRASEMSPWGWRKPIPSQGETQGDVSAVVLCHCPADMPHWRGFLHGPARRIETGVQCLYTRLPGQQMTVRVTLFLCSFNMGTRAE